MKTSKSKTYVSPAASAVHETVAGLHAAGLSSNATMREFDALCLTPVAELTPEEIKEIRLNARMSQAVFARYLNVTTSLVGQWERGEKSPSGPSLKLLTLVRSKGIESVA